MRCMGMAMVAGLLCAAPAVAQGGGKSDEICAERPGLTTDSCVVDPGRIQIETSLADWTLERDRGERTDTVLIGDSLVRAGIGGGWELRLGWTPLGIVRDRDAGGEVSHAHRVGDVSVGIKKALVQPAGKTGLSISVVASASLPVGREPVGAGDWGATLLVPLSYTLTDKWEVQATPIVQAAVDDDGHGRHALYGSAFGVAYAVSEAITADLDAQVVRDDDPDRSVRGTPALANLALAWQTDRDTQLDLGGNAGLNHAAPDLEVYAGISHRF